MGIGCGGIVVATGPTGPPGLGFAIPFASAMGTTTKPSMNSAGVLVETNVIGFSNSSDARAVTAGTDFTVAVGADDQQYLFSFPYDTILVGLSGTFSNWIGITTSPGTQIYPYVAIATPITPGTYNFRINTATITTSFNPYPAGVTVPNTTILSGYSTNLNIPIPAGTSIAIVGGLKNPGVGQAVNQYIYMHGSAFFVVAS